MLTAPGCRTSALVIAALLAGGSQFSMTTLNVTPATAIASEAPPLLDSITFGDAASEQQHNAAATNSDTVKGALDQPARRFLPRMTPENKQDWQGGLTLTRPKGTNAPWGPWLPRYPNEDSSALAGEVLPIAKVPAGIQFKPGDESIYAGKGSFYTLRYGPYLIGMNMTTDKTFDLTVPPGAAPIKELVSGKKAKGGTVKQVGPRSTVVFYMGAR